MLCVYFSGFTDPGSISHREQKGCFIRIWTFMNYSKKCNFPFSPDSFLSVLSLVFWTSLFPKFLSLCGCLLPCGWLPWCFLLLSSLLFQAADEIIACLFWDIKNYLQASLEAILKFLLMRLRDSPRESPNFARIIRKPQRDSLDFLVTDKGGH